MLKVFGCSCPVSCISGQSALHQDSNACNSRRKESLRLFRFATTPGKQGQNMTGVFISLYWAADRQHLGPSVESRFSQCRRLFLKNSRFFRSESWCRLALNGLIGGTGISSCRPVVFGRGILKLPLMSTTLTLAFAERAIRSRDYPMVSTMRDDVLCKPALVRRRWDHASINPILGRLKRHF